VRERISLLVDRYQSCADNTIADGLHAKVDQSRMSIPHGRAMAVKETSLCSRAGVRLKIHILPLFTALLLNSTTKKINKIKITLTHKTHCAYSTLYSLASRELQINTSEHRNGAVYPFTRCNILYPFLHFEFFGGTHCVWTRCDTQLFGNLFF
jgi:hypothetical protein